MYLLDLAKFTLRDNVNFSEITDTEITRVINDQQFQDLNIRGAEVFYLIDAMKNLQHILTTTSDAAAQFKSNCSTFISRVCDLSFEDYDETEVNLFSDLLYYHTLYFELVAKFPESLMMADIADLETKIELYEEYVTVHDAIWLSVESLKIMLLQLYNINFSLLEDKSKPMAIINSMNSTMDERRNLQYRTIGNIKVEQ